MKRTHLNVLALVVAVGLGAVIGSIAVTAAPSKEKPGEPAAPPEFKLPPGWTEADMQACMLAATPGKMQKRLADEAGVWTGKSVMWMYPGADPIENESTAKITPIMDGRYVKVEWSGDMPGMGPYHGLSVNGFDYVSQKFVSMWIDNFSTGLMTGTGELSDGGKTLTWLFTYNCPVTKKPATLRQVETVTGPNAKTLEMFGPEPKSGKVYRMFTIAMTRKGDDGGKK